MNRLAVNKMERQSARNLRIAFSGVRSEIFLGNDRVRFCFREQLLQRLDGLS